MTGDFRCGDILQFAVAADYLLCRIQYEESESRRLSVFVYDLLGFCDT